MRFTLDEWNMIRAALKHELEDVQNALDALYALNIDADRVIQQKLLLLGILNKLNEKPI